MISPLVRREMKAKLAASLCDGADLLVRVCLKGPFRTNARTAISQQVGGMFINETVEGRTHPKIITLTFFKFVFFFYHGDESRSH